MQKEKQKSKAVFLNPKTLVSIVVVVVLYGVLVGAVGYILTRNKNDNSAIRTEPSIDKCLQKVEFNPECPDSRMVFGYEYDSSLGTCKAVNAGGGCSLKTPFSSVDECKKTCEHGVSVVQASVGEDFLITLEANPSTGYTWEATYDSNYVALRSKDFVYDRVDPGVVGASGKEVFTFSPVRPGIIDITMNYGRKWEGMPADTRNFKYNIVEKKELSILVLKTEYQTGEDVNVEIKNNSPAIMFMEYPVVEKFQSESWSELRGSIIWPGCNVVGGMPYLKMEAGFSGSYAWDQKEKWCSSKTSDLNTYSNEAGEGRYRLRSRIVQRTKPESEDPNNVSGIVSDEYVYSNKFTIVKSQDGLQSDLKCSQKVRGFGLCKAYFEGYEFDESSGSCVKKGVSGCSFESPFTSLDECKNACEVKTDMYSCVLDSDCVSVKSDCCGCNAGGAATSINKKYQKDWNKKLNCSDIFCAAVISDDPSCFQKPVCRNNRCVLSEDEDFCDVGDGNAWITGVFSENNAGFLSAKSECEKRSVCRWKNIGGKIEKNFACCPATYDPDASLEYKKIYERCYIIID